MIITAPTAINMYFKTADTTRLTIGGNGNIFTASGTNVGIGTSSPSVALEVAGSAKLTGTNLSIVPSTGTNSAYLLNNNASGAFFFAIDNSSGTSFTGTAYGRAIYSGGAYPIVFLTNDLERMRINSTGSVSLTRVNGLAVIRRQNVQGSYGLSVQGNCADTIDDTNPGASVVVGGGPLNDTYEGNVSINAYGTVSASGNRNTIMFTNRSGTNTTTERMRIDYLGNLLVGTTSALSQTGIATFVGTGNGLVTQVGNSSTAYQSTNTSGTSAYYAAIFSNNGNTFSTCGTIQISGTSTSYNTSSDYRLKKDVQPLTNALAKIAQLKPVIYKWKSDGTDGEGFIAHELAEVCPQAVSGEKDGLKEDGSIMPQGIDTSFLVATLTKAIQEQQALIESLTTRLTALENK
jgi:hypothetical protein